MIKKKKEKKKKISIIEAGHLTFSEYLSSSSSVHNLLCILESPFYLSSVSIDQ
jgi:hypothetical protein